MAIIHGIPGLAVTVEVDGATVMEYDDPESTTHADEDLYIVASGRTENSEVSLAVNPRPYVVKYIEAKPGLPFQFRFKRFPNFKHVGSNLAFRVVADGVEDAVISDDDEYEERSSAVSRAISGLTSLNKEDRKWSEHAFRFSSLETSKHTSTVLLAGDKDYGLLTLMVLFTYSNG